MLKLTACSLLLLAQWCAAFSPAFGGARTSSSAVSTTTNHAYSPGATRLSATTAGTAAKKQEGGVAKELGLPCEDECGIERYPNLPESVHPGVLSGQAMMDLLQDAKEKGKTA